MKRRLYLVTLAVLFAVSAMYAQDEHNEKFYGEWHMQELKMENTENQDHITNEMLKSDGTYWIMKFSEGGEFFQETNFNRNARVDKMEGTWKTEPNEKLTIFFIIEGQRRPLQFYYTFESETNLILERYDQLRTMRMVVWFERKGPGARSLGDLGTW
ncbi:MAG: hypothetical protein K9J30_13250 [Bacteroidales bacterium]|nr:hypothetical protein [Bacteroidales bacterium]